MKVELQGKTDREIRDKVHEVARKTGVDYVDIMKKQEGIMIEREQGSSPLMNCTKCGVVRGVFRLDGKIECSKCGKVIKVDLKGREVKKEVKITIREKIQEEVEKK